MLEEREIKRTYLALVEGNIKKDEGEIKEKIGRDRHHATRRRVSLLARRQSPTIGCLTVIPRKT